MAEGYYFLWILYSDRFQKHKQWIIPCIVIKKKNNKKTKVSTRVLALIMVCFKEACDPAPWQMPPDKGARHPQQCHGRVYDKHPTIPRVIGL